MSVKTHFLSFFLVLIFSFLSACGGGSGGSTPAPDDTTTPPPTTTSKSTFTGIIKQSSGRSLPGVTISLEGTNLSTVTDENGVFTLPDTLSGDYVIDIDGTTATGDAGTVFGILKISATVGTEKTSSLNQVIILPDLNNDFTAKTSVSVDNGNITGGISAQTGNILLGSGGLDVLMQINGANVQGTIDVSATPVPLAELPMSLPLAAGASAGSFVTIQPPTATFSPALDLTIPNDQGLAPGTLVDIYSFDHDLNDWVNRSAAFSPPHQGVVSEDGSVIVALNVISKGGWNGPLIIADYIETVVGFVMDGSTPLEGVLVFASSGQQGITAADGSFNLLVPVAGVSIDVSITATSNAFNGAISTTTATLPTADDGASLDFGVIDLAIPSTGILSGVALQTGTASTQPVTVTGDGFTQVVTPDANGVFTLSGLPAGAYLASTTFIGDSQPTTNQFNIVTGLVTVITLQDSAGDTVVVEVSLIDENFQNPILANDSSRQVVVTLSQGSTAITQTTNASGRVTFNNITGMVTVTGQLDTVTAQGTIRLASSIHNITPVNGQIGLSLIRFDLTPPTPVQNTEISGTISNIPAIPAGFELIVIAKEQNTSDCCDDVNNPTVLISGVSIIDGSASYSLNNSNGLNTGIIAGNYTLMAVIRQVNIMTGVTLYDSAAIRPTRASTTAGETTPNVNLNFADPTMKIEFTNKSISVNNLLPLPANTDLDLAEIDNVVLLASGEELAFETFAAPFGNSLSFPAAASFITASPGGTRASYELDIEYSGTTDFSVSQGQNAGLSASNATSLSFNLINIPTISSPTNKQELSQAAANNMTVNWSDPGSIDMVFAIISSFSFNPAASNDINILWIHYLPANSSSLTIPSASINTLPMFISGSQNVLQIDTTRLSGTLNYNQLFDFDFNTRLNDAAFNGDNQSSSASLSFSIAP